MRKIILIRLLLLSVLLVASGPVARAQIFKLPEPDTTSGNFFGTAVSISGTYAIVGASGDSTCGTDGGAAYVYERSVDDQWSIASQLLPNDCKEGLFFGRSVSISGNRAVVTAYVPFFSNLTSNSVYIFDRNEETGQWTQTTRLRKATSQTEGPFASAVALDGDRILVSTSGDTSKGTYNGAAYIYDFDGKRWNQSSKLIPSLGPEAGVFGTSVAMDGDRAIISASTYLAHNPGSIFVFDRNPETDTWRESAVIRGIQDFFISVDIDGDRIVVGESHGGYKSRGRARIFSRAESGVWNPTATLAPSKKYSQGGFGSIVAISGDHVLVVGFEEQLSFEFNIDRVVYVYSYNQKKDEWSKDRIIDVGNVAFGSAVDLKDGSAVVGLATDSDPGQAFVVLVH